MRKKVRLIGKPKQEVVVDVTIPLGVYKQIQEGLVGQSYSYERFLHDAVRQDWRGPDLGEDLVRIFASRGVDRKYWVRLKPNPGFKIGSKHWCLRRGWHRLK